MNLEPIQLEELIEDLNYDTFIEEPWFVEFVDTQGQSQKMGNGHRFRTEGIWVANFDREHCEFPIIRKHLEFAQSIIRIVRTCGIVAFDNENVTESAK